MASVRELDQDHVPQLRAESVAVRVQFAGWKQFTKRRNDNPPTPRGDILRLWPVPLYIQLQ